MNEIIWPNCTCTCTVGICIFVYIWVYICIFEQCVQLACSFVCVQADELDGALVWRSAGLAVLHMLPLWTVSEGVAVSHQVDLVREANRSDSYRWWWSGSLLNSSYLGVFAWLDVEVFSINVGMNILVWMDVQQHVQLQERDQAAFIYELWILKGQFTVWDSRWSVR